MPELPEVESVRRSLAPLVGRRIARAHLLRADICEPEPGARRGPHAILQGATVDALDRRGKQLAIIARDDRVLVVHLGMTGQLRLLGPGSPPDRTDHIHARWNLDDGSRLVFRDPRRFGGLWPLSKSTLEVRWSDLGPDGLGITAEQLRAAAAHSSRPIKAVLLDQGIVAGVGNIYADEALFVSGIRPTRRAMRIRPPEWGILAEAIRQTLAAAVMARGSTLRDYVDATGASGTAQERHQVYGRGRLPCTRCGDLLTVGTVAQRTTVYCRSCQV